MRLVWHVLFHDTSSSEWYYLSKSSEFVGFVCLPKGYFHDVQYRANFESSIVLKTTDIELRFVVNSMQVFLDSLESISTHDWRDRINQIGLRLEEKLFWKLIDASCNQNTDALLNFSVRKIEKRLGFIWIGRILDWFFSKHGIEVPHRFWFATNWKQSDARLGKW